MYDETQSNKCLITITKDFKGEFDDELSVKSGEIVQFICKLDRYWYKVYTDNRSGKIPISNCREWNSTDMASIRLSKSDDQAVFVTKYDFLTDCVEGDLPFSTGEIIIGFNALNNDWWYGTRCATVVNHLTSLSVKKENCGIFPLTHVWRLRDDLLPDEVFSLDNRINIENDDDSSQPIAMQASDGNHMAEPSIPAEGNIIFYVKVLKTMNAHLSEEMDIPEIGEILGVTSNSENLYYTGVSLDRTRRGLIPKNVVQKLENYVPLTASDEPIGGDDLNTTSSTTPSPIPSTNPPDIPPPPPPPPISINFGKHVSVDFGNSSNVNRFPLDTPPSYEAAVACEQLSYGYANHMFSEIESYGRVLFDFAAQHPNELTLHENQIVRLYRHVDGGWMEGEIDGQIGFFPKSYISIIVDCEAETATAGQSNNNDELSSKNFPPNTKAKILYDFDPEMDRDLRVCANDVVTLLQRFNSTDWVWAMDAAGNVGFIHLNFCELIDTNSNSAHSSSSHSSHSNLLAINSQLTSEQQMKEPLKNSSICYPTSSLIGQEIASDSHEPEASSSKDMKPRRPAPSAPRRTNVFPTFNQFLFNDKQEIMQHELEREIQGTTDQQSAITTSTPFQKDQTSASQTSNQAKRQCVITELMQTERDYCHAMNVCLNVFRAKGVDAERCNVDVEKLLSDMRTVVNVSKSLIKLLDNYAKNRPYVDQRVGVCFLDLKFEIKEAYTKYCRNHDSTNLLLRFYEADNKSSDFMRQCQLSIQEQTNCFDISSILIKPVQRILKYPLLLNELIKCTEDTHIDWDPLLMSLQMITDIATSINEHKRRHDLIEKYCKNADNSFSGKLKNLNKHTVIKKSSRLANRFLSTLTFSSVHKDENFDEAFSKFSLVDKSIKAFIKSMKDYLHNLNEYYMQSLLVANTILEYYGKKREVEELKATHHEIFKNYFAEFKTIVERDIITCLGKLTDKFKAPWILINKRKDKLIDYDASLKSKNSDCQLAKNTFEAINQQLIEELPLLTHLSLQVFANCFQTYISANKNLICRTAKIFLNLHQLPFIKNSPFGYYQDIEEMFRVKHSLIFTQMLHDFSLIHASSFPNSNPLTEATSSATSTLSRLHIHRNSNTWKNSLPARKSTQAESTPTNDKKKQDENLRRSIESKYKLPDLYVVKQTYTPNDLFELYAECEDLVGVIKRKDPSGLDHRWYVDRGNAQGFLPRFILVSFQHGTSANQSGDSFASLVSTSSRSSSEQSMPFVASNIDLLTEAPRYDTVPEEDYVTSSHSQPSSLLSFNESFDQQHHAANFESNNSLLDLTAEFDPLASAESNRSSSPCVPTTQAKQSVILQPFSHPSIADNLYQAAFPFTAADQNQLTLESGQRVTVKQMCDLQGNSQWWYVVNSLGQAGYVPANYLKKI